jgi:hypothetical protein
MFRLHIGLVALLLALAGAGCSNKPPSVPPAAPANADEQKAVDLAQQYLDRSNLNWGAPKEIKPLPEAGTFSLSYSTPEDEVKVIGDRAVTVNVKTGEVKPVPRR